MSIPDLLRSRAADSYERLAIVEVGGRSLTYGHLDLESNAAARGLEAAGLQAGDAVALISEPSRWADYMTAYFAIQKAAGICVPLPASLTRPELEETLAPLRPRVVIVPGGGYDRVSDSWPAVTLESLVPGRSSDPFQVPVEAGAVAHVLHTSGTTGKPKPVATHHSEFPAARRRGPGRQLSILQSFNPATSAGTVGVMITQLRAGVAIISLAHFEPDEFVNATKTYRPEFTLLTPAMAEMLMRTQWDDAAMSSLRVLWISGSRSSVELLENLSARLPMAKVVNVYGLTEAPGVSTNMPFDPRHPGAVGRIVRDGNVRVVSDRGEPVRPGETGQIELLRRMAGQDGRDLFREWVRTGDLGRYDADGFLYCEGREKDIVIVGGNNVSTLEVEEALVAHPVISEACVLGVPAPVAGEDLVAVLSVRAPLGPVAELRKFLRGRLSLHKIPSRFVVVDRLPRNAMGKVARAEVRSCILGSPRHGEHPG